MPHKFNLCKCGNKKSFIAKQCRQCWFSNSQKGEKREPIVKRFWRHVKKTSNCWFWNGSKTKYGYGVFHDLRTHSKKSYAHRISWEINFGKIPLNLSVCHHCDNRLCINPKHLFLGTQADNIHDMDSKNRRIRKGPMGEKNSHAKLTEKKILKIRSLKIKGMKICEIARKFSIPSTTINHIVSRRTWKHI